MSDVRQQLIAEGVIVPRAARLTRLPPHGRPVLRLDRAGREEAERAMRDRRILRAPPDVLDVLARRPLFGRSPR